MPVSSGLLSRSLSLVTGYSPSRTQTGTLGSGGIPLSLGWQRWVQAWTWAGIQEQFQRQERRRDIQEQELLYLGFLSGRNRCLRKPHRTWRGLHATARPLATEDTLRKFWGLWTCGEQPPVMTSSSCQLTRAGSAPRSLQRSWALPSNALVCFLSNWAQRMECGWVLQWCHRCGLVGAHAACSQAYRPLALTSVLLCPSWTSPTRPTASWSPKSLPPQRALRYKLQFKIPLKNFFLLLFINSC